MSYNLEKELEADIRLNTWLRRCNGAMSETLVWLTVVTSFALTVVASVFPDAKVFSNLTFIALLSPLPGILTVIRTALGPNRKAAFFVEKEARLKNIRRRLGACVIDAKEAASEWCALEEDAMRRWQEIMRLEGEGSYGSQSGGASPQPSASLDAARLKLPRKGQTERPAGAGDGPMP
ncbi:hypothetical protein E2C06_07380 [Dankookia rubra]|uniref:Uncharacterized protein n=1 Tax=Dankookia rubra TaxID=1442381 RepID=A0A4R5QII3_9PROT|nr:hypothetical protein [Dankookia rubra]TDH63194.1 hypothetical protein E2C06_07380 [Dankookia rubra]